MRGLALVLLALVVTGAGGAAIANPPNFSWADSKHAWIANSKLRCRPRAALCATEDGGKTWHGIWLGIGSDIYAYERTSARAGLFVDQHGAWWTRDNGQHWFQTDRVLGTSWVRHHGELLVASGATLSRTHPWPPRGRARCPHPFDNGTLPGSGIRFRRNVCAAIVNAGMRAETVATVRADEGIVALAPVPSGAAGIGWYCNCQTSTFEFFVWRPDRFVETDLAVPVGYVFGTPGIGVSWPDVFVAAYAETANGLVQVTWHSGDGGRTFTRTAPS